MGKLSNVLKALKTRKAYHGTPHDFDKFDVKKIGTGEGAQAYGHGMYFSSKKEIAEYYRDALSDAKTIKTKVTGDEIPVPDPGIYYDSRSFNEFAARVHEAINASDPDADVFTLKDVNQAAGALFDSQYKFDDAKTRLRLAIADNKRAALDPNLAAQRDEILGFVDRDSRALKVLDELEPAGAGKLYEVEIPDESHMLDWDLPLSEQPEGVREAVKTAYRNATKTTSDDEALLAELFAGQKPLLDEITGVDTGLPYEEMTGSQFYNWLSRSVGDDAASSGKLRELGIPGITYKGGSSGERNFVVFDDEHVDILNKAAIAPIGMMANDFVERRAQKSEAWEALKAAASIGSSMGAGFVGDLSRAGGYLNPYYEVEETEAAADELVGQLTYSPEDNEYLQGLGELINKAEPYVEPYAERFEEAWPESVPGKVYNALHPRIRGLIGTAAETFF